MNPTPYPSLSERAEELEVAAKVAYDKGDYVFAQYLTREAHTLRMQGIAAESKHAGS
jgi:hypothetical protein